VKTWSKEALVFCDASIVLCYNYLSKVQLHRQILSLQNCILFLLEKKGLNWGLKINFKKFTIPCLQLIGVRAVSFIEHEMNLNIAEKIPWADSKYVLQVQSTKSLSVFVLVKEIKDLIFHYISSDHNPVVNNWRKDHAYGTIMNIQKAYLLTICRWPNLPWPAWSLLEITSKQLDSEVRKSRSGLNWPTWQQATIFIWTDQTILFFTQEVAEDTSVCAEIY